VEPLHATLQLVLWVTADDVEHCLSFVTWTLVSCCKALLFTSGFAQALLSYKVLSCYDVKPVCIPSERLIVLLHFVPIITDKLVVLLNYFAEILQR